MLARAALSACGRPKTKFLLSSWSVSATGIRVGLSLTFSRSCLYPQTKWGAAAASRSRRSGSRAQGQRRFHQCQSPEVPVYPLGATPNIQHPTSNIQPPTEEGCGTGRAGHPQATSKRVDRQPIATPKPPQSPAILDLANARRVRAPAYTPTKPPSCRPGARTGGALWSIMCIAAQSRRRLAGRRSGAAE